MLLFKIVLAPVLIGLVSLAGRKWGPGIAGWLLGLPLNAGPVLIFLVLEQGHGFASTAAIGSLLGIIPWSAFTLIYALTCSKLRWWQSMIVGWTGYCLVALLVLQIHPVVGWAYALVAVTLATILLLFPRPAQSSAMAPRRKYELWLRMIIAAGMVVTLTGVARALGPTRSGFFSAFPAFTTILAVFNHQQSDAAAVKVLRGVTMGLYTAATFFLVLSTALLRTSAVLSFTLAIVAAGAVQTGSLVFVRRGS